MKKIQTGCCSLSQLSLSDDDSIEDIGNMIDKMKRLAFKAEYTPDLTGIGERAVFVITTPNENKLMVNLIKLGFKKTFEFQRRNGYKQTGNLQMWCLNW